MDTLACISRATSVLPLSQAHSAQATDEYRIPIDDLCRHASPRFSEEWLRSIYFAAARQKPGVEGDAVEPQRSEISGC
ncbi:hypothetical protein [Kribbella sp. CA-294648]|uniref:hypothetical protein n=1 Tax=Kribbella sp. CA-294648 TaxID=3239948 RepID=UPI003D8E7838